MIFGSATLIIIFVLLLNPVFLPDKERESCNACASFLKFIDRGLRDYHASCGCLPPAFTINRQGYKIGGWRFLIAPYLNISSFYANPPSSRPLYNSQNIGFTSNIFVPLFQCPNASVENATCTSYVGVVGPGTAWPGERGIRLDEIKDDPSTTILLVELDNSDIEWLDPVDISLDEALGKPGEKTIIATGPHKIGGNFFLKGTLGANVLFADGTVGSLPRAISRDDLAALLSIDGGEPIDLDRVIADAMPPLFKRIRWDRCVGLPLFIVALVLCWLQVNADARADEANVRNREQHAEQEGDEPCNSH